jgi:hypothetical protein
LVVAVAVFSLQQTPAESPAEEEAQESECLPAEVSPQAARALPPRPVAVEAEVLQGRLRAAEKPQPLPSELLKLHQLPSKNTIAVVAGK